MAFDTYAQGIVCRAFHDKHGQLRSDDCARRLNCPVAHGSVMFSETCGGFCRSFCPKLLGLSPRQYEFFMDEARQRDAELTGGMAELHAAALCSPI